MVLTAADGVVVEYTANNLKKYNSVSKKVTKQEFDTVAQQIIQTAKQAYPTATIFEDYHITADVSGGIYVEVTMVVPSTNNKTCQVFLYAKVKQIA